MNNGKEPTLADLMREVQYLRVQVDRTAAASAEAVLQFRQANRLRGEDLMRMAQAAHDPKLLAQLSERKTLDKARVLRREIDIAEGKPVPKIKRDDEITLVSIRLHGDPKKWRMSKRTAFALISAIWGVLGWVAKHLHGIITHSGEVPTLPERK
jgi:hypothetical protein